MNNYNFKFAQSYQGYWNIPGIGDGIPGTLYLEKHNIHLDLFWNNNPRINNFKIDEAGGYAYALNSENKTYSYFLLNDLQCTSASWSTNGQSQFYFEIASFIITDDINFQMNNIENICIRTKFLDLWLSDYISNCYNISPIKKNGSFSIDYTPNESLTLYESDIIRVYIHFGLGWTMPSYKGFNLTTRCFFNIKLKKSLSFEEAYEMSENYIQLLAILWSNRFCPDFIEFYSGDTSFIYKQNDKYSYKYQEGEINTINTSFTDFADGDFSSIILRWIDLIRKQSDTINTLQETFFNNHLSPSTLIKNYITIIDGLTKNDFVKTDGHIQRGKVKDEYDILLKKIKDNLAVIGINKNDYNRLENAVLRQPQNSLKSRFQNMLNNLTHYITIDLESDFCEKAINTRNYITHIRDKSEIIFPKNQYIALSICLEKIIIAHILHYLGIRSEIATKITHKISMNI